jgi:RNA polymerase sigma-70 factor (sigma-E family)
VTGNLSGGPFVGTSGGEVAVEPFEGFREFVAVRSGEFFRLAYLLSGDHHTAEDLVQSALGKAAARWPRVAGYARPDAYVRRILVNEYISLWRRRRRITEDPVQDVPEGATGRDEAEAVVRRVLLQRALRRLTVRQRTVVVLRFYQDLSEADTAAEMGCSVGNVKRLCHHALGRLRALAPEMAELLHDRLEVTA